jgi:glycosyltransferase involved in cell wall biosynthesis
VTSLTPLDAAHVSVIVAVHNAETTLPALLTSLADQDCGERYEVIVADDASTDASVAVARRFAREFPVVICEAARRRGPGAARNAGVARASTGILVFCDADDIAHHAWLRSLCAAIRHYPLVAGAIYRLDAEAARPPASARGQQLIDWDGLTAYYRHLPWSMTANLAIRRDVFAEVDGFAEQLRTAEDADLCWRLAGHGVELGYEPAAIVFKRRRSGPLPAFRQYLRYGQDHPLLFRQHRHTGMPRRSLQETVMRYAGTARNTARGLRNPRSPVAVSAAARVGQDVGRVIGSLRWRSLYL